MHAHIIKIKKRLKKNPLCLTYEKRKRNLWLRSRSWLGSSHERQPLFFAGTGVARPNSLLKVSMEMRGINEAITESYTLLFTSLKIGT